MSNSVRPHRRQPTRLPHPWDSLGKNTGVGFHFLLQCMKVKSQSEVAQLCPTLSDRMDCSPSGTPVHVIFQARTLEWVAISFSVDQNPPGSELGVSCRVLHKLGKLTDRRGGHLSPNSLFWVFGGRLGWRGGEVGRSAREEAVTAHRRGFLFPLPCLFSLHISSSLTFPAHLRLRTTWMDSHNFKPA